MSKKDRILILAAQLLAEIDAKNMVISFEYAASVAMDKATKYVEAVDKEVEAHRELYAQRW